MQQSYNASLFSSRKIVQEKEILKLNKSEFIDAWEKGIGAIEAAIEYFISYYRIPVSQLLPYNALIVPFAYFFLSQYG